MRLMIAVILAFAVIGCATAKLPAVPSLDSMTTFSDAMTLGVSVKDSRAKEGVGTIGAAGIIVKKTDVVDFLAKQLIHNINREFMINVVQVFTGEPEKVVKGNDKMLAVDIKRIKMRSIDAIMEPVNVEMDIDLSLFNDSGEKIYQNSYTGQYRETIGFSIVEKKTGQLVDKVINDVITKIFQDSQFVNKLRESSTKQ